MPKTQFELSCSEGSLTILDHPEARTYRYERSDPQNPLLVAISAPSTYDELESEVSPLHEFPNAKITITIEADPA